MGKGGRGGGNEAGGRDEIPQDKLESVNSSLSEKTCLNK